MILMIRILMIQIRQFQQLKLNMEEKIREKVNKFSWPQGKVEVESQIFFII